MASLKLNAASISFQSKSQVLTGVQDAYWSDEEDTEECPLCLEEMDVSDLNFKPCPCGYQICRFCWHHIRENLNNKCPACRRDYSDENIQNKPVSRDDQRRLAQQKKQRERERKDLDALGRRHLANVRVVQRNVVYVVGIGPRFAKEELISTLRSNDYFGQYGRISKIVLTKRTPPGGQAPVVGLYITYHRREDAARCIAAVDGTASPGGGNEVMRASYGTTKYCMAFLRGVSCSDHSCMNLHEWGDEKDCFTKEDLTTLQHAIKDSEVTRKTVVLGKKADDSGARLPRSASWAKQPLATSTTSTPLHNHTNTAAPHTRSSRRDRGGEKSSRGTRGAASMVHDTQEAHSSSWKNRDPTRSAQAPKVGSVAPTSRPSTPASGARSATPAPAPAPAPSTTTAKPKRKVSSPPPPPPPRSPTSSVAQESDAGSGSGSHDAPTSADSPAPSTPAIPPGIPAVPPGLVAPPGLPPPSARGAQAQSYQMSSQVQALLNDVKARRESALPATGVSPFPDLDRTLQTLSEVNGFSFNLDPKLASSAEEPGVVDADAGAPFHGSFIDAFPALRSAAASPLLGPPGIAYPHNPARSIYDPLAARHSPAPTSPTLSYTGSFDPFAENTDDASAAAARRAVLEDGPPKMSRFGFARNARQGGASSANSPRVGATPLSPSLSGDGMLGAANGNPYEQWGAYSQQHHAYQSHTSSPLAQHAQAYTPSQQQAQQQRYQQQQHQTYGAHDVVSEAALRDLLASSRLQEQQHRMRVAAAAADQEQQQGQYRFNMNAGFADPAIMTASFAPEGRYPNHGMDTFQQFNGGHAGIPHPPPGLTPAPDMAAHVPSARSVARSPSSLAASPSPLLSPSEFPALTAQPPQPSITTTSAPPPEPDGEESKDVKRAAKQAAAVTRAAERREAKQVKERERAVRKAEREREAERKREEEERQRTEREERERKEHERKEREAKAKAEREKEERLAKEKVRAEKAAKEAKEMAKAEAARKKAAQAAVRAPSAVAKNASASSTPAPELEAQGPLLSKMPKKNKPATKPIRIPKEGESVADTNSAAASAIATDAPPFPAARSGASTADSNSLKSSSRGQSIEREQVPESSPTPVAELLAQIQDAHPEIDLAHHVFFDPSRLNPASKMPLEYGPLVHALSALSVGGGSFASSMPPGSIDHAVSSFQQLLETLTQTISDLLRLLPRTTWDDSSSFDGVLRDMLKGDDFLDLDNPDAVCAHAPPSAQPATLLPPTATAPAPAAVTTSTGGGAGKDEVAALTQALERRARWMEVQLCKLEELHRDINTAAVRAVLAFNDGGWDPHGFAPRAGNTLQRFDALGLVDDGAGGLRQMSADELDKKLAVAKEVAVFAEAEVREMMDKMRVLRPAAEF